MNSLRVFIRSCFPLAALALVVSSSAGQNLGFRRYATTPPMGWNSWDCFGTGVSEVQVRENAAYMSRNLRRHGWNIVTIDIDWFVGGATGWDYRPNAQLELDPYGRVLPAPDRFPSSAGGKGFKPLADDLHRQGLKLGLHLLRGIPRRAVDSNLPILGSAYKAGEIADKLNICPWNSDMYGVDMGKPGAQAYYDSLFRLLASWGVDFVKVDDLSSPYHQAEIEAIRKAIDASGRAITFSTSPGPTGTEHGEHIEEHANMWRISGDFWDDWPALKGQFDRMDKWSSFRGEGHWPDADMLPLGAVRQGQRDDWTHFTETEQTTLMTLWGIGGSPLILGGDLPRNDPDTLALLTNEEVLAVNQHGNNSRQLWRKGEQIAWVADVPHSRDKYLAVFNTADQKHLDLSRAAFQSGVVSRSTLDQSVGIDIDVSGASRLYLYADDAGDGIFADHIVWAKPMVTTDKGDVRLTDFRWLSATEGWGHTDINHSATGGLLVLNGKLVDFGIGSHANSMIVYGLPIGAKRLRVIAGLGKEGVDQDHGATVRFAIFTQDPMAGSDRDTASVQVDLKDFGFDGPVRIRDLWKHQNLGVFSQEFAPSIPGHGASLYRLSPR